MPGRPEHGFEIGNELGHHGMEVYGGRLIDADMDWGNIEEELALAQSEFSLGNAELPIHNYRQQIIETIRDNPVTLIVAETGAGKSTQVPQFLLDEDFVNDIYHTQPRRVAARNVSERIRDEISSKRGRFAGEDLVSFQTAAEKVGPDDARIKFVTDGLMVVKELHDSGTSQNDVLIIDEVHEWNSNVEVLVAWTKRALAQNPNFRVVIMSADMEAESLASYYGTICEVPPPIIEVPGRTHAVEKSYKPDSTMEDELISTIMGIPDEDSILPEEPHDILLFYPGKAEIYDAIGAVRKRLPKNLGVDVKLLPLHAKLSKTEQMAALTEYPDCIKVVFSTNLAQSSLTVPGVRYVFDSGMHRTIVIDEEGSRGLVLAPISQADINQRAGRVGRVGPGEYTLTKLNEQTPCVGYEDREEYPTPEILRTDVARSMLRLKALDLEIEDFDMYHTVSDTAIKHAVRTLYLLGAVDQQGAITELGEKMNAYPLSVSSARIMVESERYNEQIRTFVAAMVSSDEAGGMQYFARNVGKNWRELTSERTSDLLAQLDLFIASQNMGSNDIKTYDLDINNRDRARETFAKVCRLADIKPALESQPTLQERDDIRLSITAGYLDGIYEYRHDRKYGHAFSKDKPTPREISSRSVVSSDGPNFLLGRPYRIETDKGIIHSLENITAVTAQQLGQVAASHIIRRETDLTFRDGKPVAKMRQLLFGEIDLGFTEEVRPRPSPRLRQEIISYALEHPEAAQIELRKIKKQLEKLAMRTPELIPQLTHEQLEEIVHRAAPPDITSPSEIEDNLRILLSDPESGLNLDSYLSPEKRQNIMINSPDIIQVDDATLSIDYKQGVPRATHFDEQTVLAIESDEVCLEDGREILFRFVRRDGNVRYFDLSTFKLHTAARR